MVPRGPLPRQGNPQQQGPRVPAGYRRVVAWRNWVDADQDNVSVVWTVCPAGPVSFPTVAPLDHILSEVYIEFIPGSYDPQLLRATLSCGLWRWIPSGNVLVVPDEEPGANPAQAANTPHDGTIREYLGAKHTLLEPMGQLLKWTFKPRPGDRVDSLQREQQPLVLVVDALAAILRPPSGDPLEEIPEFLRYRVGGAWYVRDRQGLLV